MTPDDHRKRTAAFATRVFEFARPLLNRAESRQAGDQLIRASSSVAANYRAAGRARSHAEFTAKIGQVLEEADESFFWLEYLRDCRLVSLEGVTPLIAEARELVAIFTSANQTAKAVERTRRARLERHR